MFQGKLKALCPPPVDEVLVGTWNGDPNLSAGARTLGVVHAVYMTMNTRGAMRRWIRLVDHYGVSVGNSRHKPSRPACKHEGIHYLSQLRNKSKEFIDALLSAQLAPPAADIL